MPFEGTAHVQQSRAGTALLRAGGQRGGLGGDGCGELVSGLVDRLLGAAFSGDEDADALDHLGGRAGTLGEKDVGGESAVEGADGSGDDHGGEAGVELLGAADELIAVHLGHEQVAEEKVDRTWEAALDYLEGVLRGACGKDAVATGFEEEGADREDLFVIVDAEDGLLWAHAYSLLPRGRSHATSWRMGRRRAAADWPPHDAGGALSVPWVRRRPAPRSPGGCAKTRSLRAAAEGCSAATA